MSSRFDHSPRAGVAWPADLPPGAEECTTRVFTQAKLSVHIDVDNNVAEGRENNNAVVFMLPTPLPPPACTPTRTPTVVE